MMAPEALLERLAATLRREIGPAVAEPFPRTQAFMAAVILEKLARQLRAAVAGAGADVEDRRQLLDDLEALLGGGSTPAALTAAVAAARSAADQASLCRIVEELYAGRTELGDERFESARERVRRTLRARLDRQMAYAS